MDFGFKSETPINTAFAAGTKGKTRKGLSYEITHVLDVPTTGGNTLLVLINGNTYLYPPCGHRRPGIKTSHDLLPPQEEYWVNLLHNGRAVWHPTEQAARDSAKKWTARGVYMHIAAKLVINP